MSAQQTQNTPMAQLTAAAGTLAAARQLCRAGSPLVAVARDKGTAAELGFTGQPIMVHVGSYPSGCYARHGSIYFNSYSGSTQSCSSSYRCMCAAHCTDCPPMCLCAPFVSTRSVAHQSLSPSQDVPREIVRGEPQNFKTVSQVTVD